MGVAKLVAIAAGCCMCKQIMCQTGGGCKHMTGATQALAVEMCRVHLSKESRDTRGAAGQITEVATRCMITQQF